jgi:hypothetical protein
VAGTSNYPGALDNFAEASPTNLGDEDSTGRTHSERHDDLEAAMEAVQEELGTDPSGASASTVAARFTALDSTVAGRVAASVVTTAGDLIVGAGSASVTRLGKGTEGYVLTSSSAGAQGLIWAEASGGATVEMSPTEPVSPDNGTLWVDTDSDVPTFTASAYVLNALIANSKGALITSTGSAVAALPVGTNDHILTADSTAANGIAWKAAPASGIPATLLDAKGDLIVATAADTAARLAVGTNGQALVADSGASAGVKWAGVGKVLQVVSATKTDTSSTNSNSWADISGLSVTVTPTSSSSTFVVMYTVQGSSAPNASGLAFKVLRNSTDIAIGDTASNRPRVGSNINLGDFSVTTNAQLLTAAQTFVDSPATTSSITYKVQFRTTQGGSTTCYVNRSVSDRDTTNYDARGASSIVVMEIGA